MSADEVAQLMPRSFPRMCPSTTPPVEWPKFTGRPSTRATSPRSTASRV